MLSPQLLNEFKKIMKEEYGVELNDMDAHRAATNLVGYFDLLIKIDYKNKQKEKGNKVKAPRKREVVKESI